MSSFDPRLPKERNPTMDPMYRTQADWRSYFADALPDNGVN